MPPKQLVLEAKAQEQLPMQAAPKVSLRSRLPSLFQVWMAFSACVELSPIFAIGFRGANVVEVGPWFDRRSFYTTNPALAYLYMTIPIALMVARALACYRPQLVILILYAAAVHWLELVFFLVVLSAKQDWRFDEVKGEDTPKVIYFIMFFVFLNPILLTFRFFALQSSLRREKVENEELRRKQLAEIRKMRAEYKQKKLAEKNK